MCMIASVLDEHVRNFVGLGRLCAQLRRFYSKIYIIASVLVSVCILASVLDDYVYASVLADYVHTCVGFEQVYA